MFVENKFGIMKYKYRDVKGLETERRDYCDFSRKVFDNIWTPL